MFKSSPVSKNAQLTKFLAVSLGLSVAGLSNQSAHADVGWVGGTSSDWNNTSNWGSNPSGQTLDINNTGNTGVYPIISSDSTFTPVDLRIGTGATGRLDQTAGSAGTGNNNWLFLGYSGGNATLNLANTSASGGTFTGYGEGSGSFYAGNILSSLDNGTVSTINVNTSGSLTTNALFDGASGNNTATFNLDNGAVTVNGDTQLTGPGAFNGQGTGTATLNISGGSFSTDYLEAAEGGGTGNINISGGSLAITQYEMQLGKDGATTVNQSGGTVSSVGYFVIGRDSGGNALYNLSSGTANAATGYGFPTIASFSGATGVLNVSGNGIFNASNSSQLNVGEGGNGTLSVSGSGAVIISNTSNGLELGVNSGGVGTVNLNGGTITTELVSQGGGSGTFNFNGGVLEANQSTASFMQGLTNAYVLGGGAIINNNGDNITIGQALLSGSSADGGLTAQGSGALTLSGNSTFNGHTTVSAGTLLLSGTFSGGTSTTIAGGATFDLVSSGAYQFNIGLNGVNNSITDSGGTLTLDGAFNVNLGSADTTLGDVWDLVNGAASYTGNFNVPGFTDNSGIWVEPIASTSNEYKFNQANGQLSVVPEPSTWMSLLTGIGAIFGFGRLRRRGGRV